MAPEPFDEALAAEPQGAPVRRVAAVAEALQQRWLPADPWQPEEEWLDQPIPEPPVAPTALSVLMGLGLARRTLRTVLRLDPLRPESLRPLSRLVATLNRRSDALRPLAEDWRPWQALDTLAQQADTVGTALQSGLLDQAQQERQAPTPFTTPWRKLLTKVKALVPLIPLADALDLDLSDPDWVDTLATQVRILRRVDLPKLEDPGLVLQVMARNDAIKRLQQRFGPVPFQQVRAAVAQQVRQVLTELPPEVRMVDDQLEGVSDLQPNPSTILNAYTMQAVRRIDPKALERLNWRVPDFAGLSLLTVGTPVAALVSSWPTEPGPARPTPCDNGCDARRALDALEAADPQAMRQA